MICGEEIEPFCIPTKPDVVAGLVSAGTNLFWWAMHEALADGRFAEAEGIGKMIVDIVARELDYDASQEAREVIDETLDNYRDSDFDPMSN